MQARAVFVAEMNILFIENILEFKELAAFPEAWSCFFVGHMGFLKGRISRRLAALKRNIENCKHISTILTRLQNQVFLLKSSL